MSFNVRIKNNQNALTSTGVAGAAPQTVAGNTVLVQKLEPGSLLAAKIVMIVKTSSLTMTPSFQGSVDNVTWEDLFPMNSAANVATAAGTGSAVTTSRTIVLPMPAPYRYMRAVVKTAGATAVITDDFYSVLYHYVEKDLH